MESNESKVGLASADGGARARAKVKGSEATEPPDGADRSSLEPENRIGLDEAVMFRDWKLILEGSELPRPEKKSFEITINWFLSYCKRARCGVCKAGANEFIRTVRIERDATRFQVNSWSNALRWFFREAVLHAEAGAKEIPAELVEAEHAFGEEEVWHEDFIRVVRRMKYKYTTELGYLSCLRGYAKFCGTNDLKALGKDEVRRYLDYLAVERRLSASSQKQALNAIVFLYKSVYRRELGDFSDYLRARPKTKLPTVLSEREIEMLFERMKGVRVLMAKLQYGTGLRVSELCRLRVMDVDFDMGKISVVNGKGGEDRVVPLPRSLRSKLEAHLAEVKELYRQDRDAKLAGVYLPEALERKFSNAGKTWNWFWVFPSRETSVDPRSGIERRHHLLPRSYQNTIAQAAAKTEITKRVTSHVLRHSFATHSLEAGLDIRTLQELMGHKQIKTTQIYLHLVRTYMDRVVSPLDRMLGEVEP